MSNDLHIRITSFSFKGSYPKASDSHGGGFVFDMRCLPNPGRERAYKDLTGRDAAVIEYLEKHEEVSRFKDSVFSLIDQAVENYLRREFTSLAVAFGCTGGQHRSVYFAEELGRHLRGRSGMSVEVTHRELGEVGSS